MATKPATNGHATNGHATNGHAANGTPRNIEANINYYLDPSKGGITWYTPGSAMILRRKFDTQPVTINDMRGREDEFEIHKHSFQFAKFKTACKNITDEEVKRIMYPEAEALLKKM
jgi:hypothetical protein